MKHCLDCTMKHIESAMVVHEEEVFLGYPEHIHIVRGNLAQASRESVGEYPEFGNALRLYRLRTLEDPDYVPPYMELLAYVDILVECDNNNVPAPEFPKHLLPDAEKPT